MINKIIENCSKKMCLKLNDEEEKLAIEAIKAFDIGFDNLEVKFPDLNKQEPMHYTIHIEPIILREDEAEESTDINELLKNTTNVNEREVEVPKVVS